MSSLHLIDPDGDVELLLRREVEPADWDIDITPSPSNLDYRREFVPEVGGTKKKGKKGRAQPFEWGYQEPEPPQVVVEVEAEPEPAPEPEPEPEAEPEQAQTEETSADLDTGDLRIRIRVSSKHLMLASSYFKRSLGGKLAEGHTLQSEGYVEIDMDGHDLDEMLLVMNMIHGRFRQLPSSVDLSTLTRIAVLTDYFHCHEVVEPFVDQWIERIRGEITQVYSKELIQWLCISQVFRKGDLFKAITRTALRQSRDLFDTPDLPIWNSVEDELNRQRTAAIEKLLSGLTSLLQDLLYDRDQCGYECNAFRYGLISKELASRGLHSPGPQAPFLGYSFENIASSIVHIQGSPLQTSHSMGVFGSQCAINTQISPLVQQVEQSFDGLSFDKFKHDDEHTS
ncbi:hypothetical protein K491DRAFT_648246 [Lophiostoma macrostomum CBS 122681]|uniref:BTB domain-containing protein n=1 Tax=Lophiostoma macrostomum CBS 122681 TaxID=1314788 RepID=A0A6A6TPS1_9PLEO|nr:hypothetical protein K491DRAFT_648246 [Lophiostoma macrostomum CBS 122681]